MVVGGEGKLSLVPFPHAPAAAPRHDAFGVAGSGPGLSPSRRVRARMWDRGFGGAAAGSRAAMAAAAAAGPPGLRGGRRVRAGSRGRVRTADTRRVPVPPCAGYAVAAAAAAAVAAVAVQLGGAGGRVQLGGAGGRGAGQSREA